MQLTNEERETLIYFDETPNDAVIFTYNRAWKQHLEKKLGLKCVFDNGYGGREYHINKKRIPMPRAKRKITPEQRQNSIERLTKARQQKSSNSLGKHTRIKESQAKKKNPTNATGRKKKA